MSRYPKWRSELEKYDDYLELAGRSSRYISIIKNVVKRFFNFNGKKDPVKVDAEDIQRFLMTLNCKSGAKRINISYIRGYLRYCGNHIDSRKIGFRYREDGGQNVDWLDPDQIDLLLSSPMDPLERLIVHLALELGGRSIWIRSLKLSDIGNGWWCGTDKNTKWRRVPFSPDSQRILDEYLQVREGIIQSAREKNHSIMDPGYLIIHQWKKSLVSVNHPYLRRRLIKAGEKVGLRISKLHTLRRTCGREMRRAGMDPYVISRFYNHSHVQITDRYIRADEEELKKELYEYFRRTDKSNNEISTKERV